MGEFTRNERIGLALDPFTTLFLVSAKNKFDPFEVPYGKEVLFAAAVGAAYYYGGPQAGAAVAGLGLGTAAQIQATGAQEVELELAARNEKLAAAGRESARRDRLVAVLGAQRAQAAASGVAIEGSVANVSISDAENASIDRLLDRTSTRITLDSLARQRKSIGRAGVLQAGASALSIAGTLSQSIKINKPATTTTKVNKRSIGKGNL